MNAVFHLGASLWFRNHSPGLATALGIYPALFWVISRTAWIEGLLSTGPFLWGLLIAAVVHAMDVSSSVFLLSPRSVKHHV